MPGEASEVRPEDHREFRDDVRGLPRDEDAYRVGATGGPGWKRGGDGVEERVARREELYVAACACDGAPEGADPPRGGGPVRGAPQVWEAALPHVVRVEAPDAPRGAVVPVGGNRSRRGSLPEMGDEGFLDLRLDALVGAA